MSIKEVKEFCDSNFQNERLYIFKKNTKISLERNRVYVTSNGQVLLFLGNKGNQSAFVRLGYCILDSYGDNRYRVFDGKISFCQKAIDNLITYIYINQFDRYFIFTAPSNSINFIGVLDYKENTSELESAILRRWGENYLCENPYSDHRSYVYNDNTALVKGAVYLNSKDNQEYVYLGLQYCNIHNHYEVKLNDQHLFIKKPKDLSKINSYVNNSAISQTSNFKYNIKIDNLTYTGVYVPKLSNDNSLRFDIGIKYEEN